MDTDQSAGILRLRATVRDLLALSMIPETWVGREPSAIATDLVDLLVELLQLDFAFVRLCDPTGCQVVEVTRGNSWKTFQEWLQQHLTVFGQLSRKEIVTNVNGVEESCCGIVIPVGVDSKRGLVVAASDRFDFPDQIDEQLLSVAANNAATAFQNAFLIKELRSAQEALRTNEQELRKARDELENKVAERTSELRRSERELRDAIDTIPALVWTALPDGSNTYVNKRFVEYTGSSAEQTTGSGWQALVHPDDLERHAGKWMEAVATGKPHESEVRSRRSDGQYRWQLDRGVPLRDEDGNIVKWYGVTTDIEDRKRAEEALQLVSSDLQDSKAKLEEAQRITHVGYWEWDILTGRVNWSDETYRIYGLRPQERPMDLATVREKIHPDDWGGVFRALEEALSGGARYKVEYRVFRPTGELRIIDSQGDVKRDTSGRPTLMFGTVQDITDRKRAQEALQQNQFYLAEGQRLAHMGSWAFNPSGFFEYWSQELFKIYGLDPQKGAPTLEEYLATVHPQDRDFMADTIKRMHAERSGCDVKKRIVRPDGGQRYIRCVGIPVIEGEVFKGFLGTAIDITEQELLTQELERQRMYLTEAEKLTHTGSWAYQPDREEVLYCSDEFC
jgi:PAS domain S-box-containing protein